MKQLLLSPLRWLALTFFGLTKQLGIPTPARIVKHAHYRGVVKVPLGPGEQFNMQSYGHAIENRLYWYGKLGHEPESFLPWLKAAKKANVVLDIGANSGLYSLGAGAVNSAAQIFAFEPLPRVAALIRHNAALNPDFKISVEQNAVCDVSGPVTLHDPGGDQPASASLDGNFLSGAQDTIEVQGIRIDEFVQRNGLSTVDLIKLDVEGVEELALQGMRETIAQFRPTLLIEVLDNREALINELQSLLALGYAVGDLQQTGLKKHDLGNDNKNRERNLLFTVDLDTFPELA